MKLIIIRVATTFVFLTSIIMRCKAQSVDGRSQFNALRYNENLIIATDSSVAIEIKVFSPPSCNVEFLERNLQGLCGDRGDDCAFSPFNDASRSSLVRSLDAELMIVNKSRVFLKFALPYENKLGFSDLTRQQYIEFAKVDPIDIFSSYNIDLPLVRSWRSWRQNKVTDFVEKMTKKRTNLISSNRIVADSKWLLSNDNEKENSCENWPSWAKAGLVDEIALEGEWEKPENKKLIALAREALAGTKVKMTVALDTRRDGKALDPLTQLLNLQGEKIDGVVVKVEDPADLPRAQAFVKDVLPEFEFGLDKSEPVAAPQGATPAQTPN